MSSEIRHGILKEIEDALEEEGVKLIIIEPSEVRLFEFYCTLGRQVPEVIRRLQSGTEGGY